MSSSKYQRIITLTAALGLLCIPASVGQDKTVLHGAVNKQGFNSLSGDNAGTSMAPSLSRRDLGRTDENMTSRPKQISQEGLDGNQLIDAPHTAFQGASTLPPRKNKSFGLGAELDDFLGKSGKGQPDFAGQSMNGNPDFAGQRMSGTPDGMPGTPGFAGQKMPGMPDVLAGIPGTSPFSPAGMQSGSPPRSAAVDPDNTREMQLAWDAWHRRVAEAIFQRFDFYAKAAFKNSPPLAVRVSYTVTKNGNIQDVRFLQRSPNIMFNALVTQCVKSLHGDVALLQFPQGSRRQTVEKTGNFTQNYGDFGFRHVTGDRETVRHR